MRPDTPDMSDGQFLDAVRKFLRDNLPPDMAQRGLKAVHPTRDDQLAMTTLLSRAGWSVPNWPVAYGGPGWSAHRRGLFEEELMMAGAPPNNIQGISLAGPVIYTFGTEAQKARYLAPIREGREYWAQGFSEPGAGSDLASLRTRAVREGEGPNAVYVVNGQKIWTSQAYMADMLFCLVRTDPAAKPQRGISFLLIDLKTPGITIRPIESIDEGKSLCEVFFDDVRVPVANLIGEENKGWDYTKFLLGNERVAVAEVPGNKRNLATLQDLARRAPSSVAGQTLYDEPVFRSRIAKLELDLLALEAAVVSAIEVGDSSPLTPSALKIHGTELLQALLGMQVEALGAHGAAFYPPDGPFDGSLGPLPGPAYAPSITANYMFCRCMTILGGSNEIQKNIISKLLFAGTEPTLPPLSDDQMLLQQSAEAYAADYRTAPWSERASGDAGLARKRWQAIADTGFIGLGIAEELGGYGGSLADLAVLSEAFGRGGVSEPMGSCAFIPGRLLAQAAWPAERRQATIERLVSGEVVAVFAHVEAESGGQGTAALTRTHAAAKPGGFVMDGAKCAVMGGAMADAFIVSARTAGSPGDRTGLSLFWVPRDAPGLQCINYRSVDGQVMADLRLNGVTLGEDALISAREQALPAIEAAIDIAMVMACAEAVGTMATVLTVTRDYLLVRKQFGSPLAGFQALQHRLAEMYGELALARALLGRCVVALEADAAERARFAAAAKARIGRAAFFVGSQGIQLHGGIGMTQECVVGHYFKCLHTFEVIWGNSNYHSERFARLGDSVPE